MKLNYRGIAYDYTPPDMGTRATTTAGTYREVEHYFTKAVADAAVGDHELCYRGVHSHTEPGVGVADVPVAAPVARTQVGPTASSVESLARALMMSRHNWIKNREQSLLARSGAEVGLADASHYWSQIQGKINPSFRVSYDRSRATFS